MKNLRVLFINLVIFLFLFEGLSFLYFHSGISLTTYEPSYVQGVHKTEAQWMTEFEDWGAWHLPNGKASFERRCITTNLLANSFGARDRERMKESASSRVVVLGDSFAEGYGISTEFRFSDVLEERLEKEFLNFGASGNFGPVQYYILYRDLVRSFDHDTVLISFLPDNDFTDNDPKEWNKGSATIFKNRYRPYYRKLEQGYEVFYPAEKPQKMKTFAEMTAAGHDNRSIKSKIQRMTWMYGIYREIKAYKQVFDVDVPDYSGYFDMSQSQIEASLYFVGEIKKLARNKRVILFTIPRLGDLRKLQQHKSHLPEVFKSSLDEMGVEYLDLTQETLQAENKLESLFIPCDGHWDRKGHRLAADILQKHFFSP
ncbi:SGNH/GDSL hydrolase family protein [Terasakiella sp. SH-1]|uniref:SGNH/GDSL hydrolase family protein n=1 Tax=Terasakiella sp. SH-1 TaxID=2560057 RepID=UPI001073EF47|nr:SGNH/GDSL hydrolase family protein [Terasakiella sp. SH-1]